MSSILDYMTLEERRADLFTLADLIPDRQLQTLQASGYSVRELEHRVTCEIKRCTPTWPADRIADRRALRLSMLSVIETGL